MEEKPVFGSLNCVNHESWVAYAKKIEEIGAAGIEINLYHVPSDFEIVGNAIINEQLDIIEAIKKVVKIPIAVKLSPYYTNPLFVVKEMDKRGADAFVLQGDPPKQLLSAIETIRVRREHV